MTCQCRDCRASDASREFETYRFDFSSPGGSEGEQEAGFGPEDGESPFDESEEAELAMELLAVASEAELDQFLGKLIKGAWKGVKKVGKAIAPLARPLGGALRGLAKTALPFVGGALGSFIPIPGVGTAIGTAVGSAVGSALEMEFTSMETEEREFEMARRFVRIAGTAAQQAAQAAARLGGSGNPTTAVRDALQAAARAHLPRLARGQGNGRWERRGNRILVSGV
jgi:hypothetical protein